MHKALPRGTTIMGRRFITSVAVVSGGFRRIPILMHLGVLRNNLNNSLPKALSIVLLLLASFVKYFDHFLAIHGHPSFVT
jgi:hypothetical protein